MTLRRSAVLLVPVVASMLLARPAAACASCGCGDSTLTATGVERPYPNRLRIALEERYGSLSMGEDAVAQRVQFLRTALAVSWSPLSRLTVSALLPWVTSFITVPGLPHLTVSGLGDLELSARAVIFRERAFAPHHVLWVGAGLKFPTGYHTSDVSGLPVANDDQPGSGSWDPFGNVTYAWFGGHVTSFFASTALRWTTAGWNGYRRGQSVGGTLAVQLQPWSRVAFQLGVDLLWTHSDTLSNGHAVPDTGGFTGYLAGGLLANPWRDLLLRLVVEAPALQLLSGTQSVGPQVALQISYDF
jgi:hypothetical protein